MTTKRTGHTVGLLTAALLASPALQAQLADSQAVIGTVNDMARQPLDAQRELQRAASEAAQQAASTAAAAREAALDPVTRALANPLAALPAALPVVDINGQTAFVEVAVEDGWRAVAGEWLAWLPAADSATLTIPGITIVAIDAMPALGLQLVRFRVAPALDNRAALEQQLPAALHAHLDRNHTFDSQSDQPDPAAGAPLNPAPQACARPAQIGMVDTGVQTSHPAFVGAKLHRQDFLPAELAAPEAHGTAVAGLLVGRGGGLIRRLPGATLYAASAFYARSDYSQGATTQSLLHSLEWLLAQRVAVINLSLAGPPNRLLGLAVTRIAERQVAMVAAVGNEGPASVPLYPAAYPEVLAVTAVDNQRRIYRWANQGEHVDFAAPGVSVLTARALADGQTEAFGRESGTSMAAPVVTARIACAMAHGDSLAVALSQLRAQALDVGAPGPDAVFGAGLIF